MDKTTVSIVIGTVLLLAGIVFAATATDRKAAQVPAHERCVEHAPSLSMHIHPKLEIFIDEQKVLIPGSIGITPECMRSVHTHEENGTLHIEYPEAHDFLLGDFFANWGQAFDSTHVLDKVVDETHTLTMTVDGVESTDFEKLVLRDGQAIVIRYLTKK